MRSLDQIAIFDCTFGEAKLGAMKECKFCSHILGLNPKEETEDDEFLAAAFPEGWDFGDFVNFGVLRLEVSRR